PERRGHERAASSRRTGPRATVARRRALPQDGRAVLPAPSPAPSAPVPPAPSAPPATVSGRRTRVALVGSGYIAGVHLQVLRAVPDVRVVALCDVHHERAARLAKKHGIAA